MNRKNARFIVSLLWKQPIQKEAEYAEGELYSDCHLYSESITISSLVFCFCFFFFQWISTLAACKNLQDPIPRDSD